MQTRTAVFLQDTAVTILYVKRNLCLFLPVHPEETHRGFFVRILLSAAETDPLYDFYSPLLRAMLAWTRL